MKNMAQDFFGNCFYLVVRNLKLYKRIGLLSSSCRSYSSSLISQSVQKRSQQCVPKYTSATDIEVRQFQLFLNCHKRLVVLTGAGISTESGQPDYRSEEVGLYARSSRRPVMIRDFMSNARIRQRYWLRNYAGWPSFSALEPNENHHILADWQRLGKVTSLITQNVDRLHHKAGSVNVVELHGTTYNVRCMSCTYTISRAELQEEIKLLNPGLHVESLEIRPDSDVDVDLSLVDKFVLPACPVCGGFLKPDAVFFGENVPGKTVDAIYQKIEESDAVLVLGSSLQVYSGYRFVVYALDLKLPVAVVNIGPTRADGLVGLKIDSKCSEVLRRVNVSV